MDEWSTYSLEDFLLFAPSTYERLFVRHNADLWPLQVPLVILGLMLAAATWRAHARARPAVFAVLAAIWLWVGWSFLALRYAEINWAALYAAWAFAVQAALLLACAVTAGGRRGPEIRAGTRWIGFGLIGFGLVIHPLLAPLLGRAWSGIELLGLAPDPTAASTLGFVVALAPPGWRWTLVAVPALWCCATAMTLLAIGEPSWIAPLLAAVLAATALVLRRRETGTADA